MKSYIKFMLLGTSLLTSNLYAGVDQNNNQSANPAKEEQSERTVVEELIKVANDLRKTIEDANNGSIEFQDLVAETFIKYPQLLDSDELISAIQLDSWHDLEKRVENNPNLLVLIIRTALSKKVDRTVGNSIFKVLDEKYSQNQSTSEEIEFLGYCYYHGHGVAQDKTEAAELFDEAAKLGNARATFNLGYCYYHGHGVAPDKTKAAKLYGEAAKLGNARATFNLGYCYYHGHGVAQDKTEAVKLYGEAAGLGYARAICSLGVCYEHGDGVPQDKTKAAKLYGEAAKLGDARAMCNLGVCYYNGEGVEKNLITALKWCLECLKPKEEQEVKARATTKIKDLISLEASTDYKFELGELLKKIGLISKVPANESEALKLDKELKLTLDGILKFHMLNQQMYSDRFKGQDIDQQDIKYNAHKAVLEAADNLLSFVTKITPGEEDLNNNSIVNGKAFKIPTGFMLTNVNEKKDLSGQLRIDRANKIEDSVFSITKLRPCYYFCNIGHDAVKLASELPKLIENLSKYINAMIEIETGEMDLKMLAYYNNSYERYLILCNHDLNPIYKQINMTELNKQKDSITEEIQKNNLLYSQIKEKKVDEKLISFLKNYQQHAKDLEKNLETLAKSAGPRNKEFAEFIGWGE